MKYNLIIFDLDGTLANTLSDIADITNRMLKELGYPTHTQEEYRYFVGNGLKKLVERSLLESARSEELIENGFQIVLKDYTENPIDKTCLYSGVGDLLNELEKINIKKAILSNKADPITQKICNSLLNKWHFDIIIGSGKRFPNKPDPSSANYIAKALETESKNVLYVGDSNVDMQTAKAAGFNSVGVTWGFRTKEELIENGATYTIDSPIELLKILNLK